MSIRLSNRLTAVAGMVTPGSRLCDVGCDHAWVPVFLAEEGRIPHAIAMDVAEGPLGRARENIRKAGLSDCIEARLSDGLTAYVPGEADSLVIAGMGGILMASILEKEPGKTASFREIILGPQREFALLRSRLRGMHLGITGEKLIREDGKFYPILYCVPGAAGVSAGLPQRIEDRFGPSLLAGKDPVLPYYLDRQREIEEKILQSLPEGDRADEVRQDLADIALITAYLKEDEP
ncbi:MAG: class I SAM-dependent methyltransferase [Lachnospiraceae bacterium]|jgi:tRNA (adenine22-N1)-methyltransferase|nr:class I SAM-dependent methyltransferase [Lachnospiraceae bacterium]